MASEPERRLTGSLAVVFALTGASALALQVIWQRVISMHSGVDLWSSTTVVAGFLAGLGVGSVLGGRLADRLGPRRSLWVFAAANVGVAAFAAVSITLFYDVYRDLAPRLASPVAAVAFNIALLLVPTTLQGLSLPLVARAVTRRDGEAGRRVGWLYGVNTFGAAVGAVWAGWFLMGKYGFVTSVRLAGGLNLVAAGLVLLLLARTTATDDEPDPHPEAPTGAPSGAAHAAAAGADDPGPSPWRWYVVYATTGAVALGFQQVFFRFVDAAMRSNSYSFSLVLAMYLGAWGLGAAVGARRVQRVADPRPWFAWLQIGSAIAAAAVVVLIVRVLPHVGFGDAFGRWFSSDGFAPGFADDDQGEIIWFALLLPALVIVPPILLLGASYPFVQAIVAPRVVGVGRRTGALAAANIAGNVVGTVVVGFVLIDLLGTAGTYRLLTALAGLAGLVLVVAGRPATRRRGIAAVAVTAALVAALPGNDALWRFLVGGDELGVETPVAEDHSCASALRISDTSRQLVINGAPQNDSPFDDFHVLIGLLPMLVHDDPRNGLAIGFGIGSTTYAMLADPRVDRVTTVELCGGNYDLARLLGRRGIPELRSLFADRRSTLLTGDGRRHLLVEAERHDAVVVDTLRPTSANSGSHFSSDFFRLVSRRLTDDGIMAEWIPSVRVRNAAAQAFPYAVVGVVPEYTRSEFFLASRSPITIDRAAMLRRFDAIPEAAFTDEQRTRLRDYIARFRPTCLTNGRVATGVPSEATNRDLWPRDEFSLDNPVLDPSAAVSTC